MARYIGNMPGDLFAVNGAMQSLFEEGIEADYFVMLDAREETAEFIDSYNAEHYLISSQCHPASFDKLKGENVTLWHPHYPGIEDYIGDEECALIGGGTTVGLQAMGIAYAMGYREIHLYGFDSSYEDGQGHAYAQALNDSDKTEEYTVAGEKFVATSWMARQAMEFQSASEQLADGGAAIAVHGTGLLPTIAAEMQKQTTLVNGGTLTVTYDLSQHPSSFDAATWLIYAQMYRANRGFDKLAVYIKPGFRNDNLPMDQEYRDLMVKNVVEPLISLVGAEIVESGNGDIDFNHTFRSVCNLYKSGIEIHKIRSKMKLKYDEPYITVTLREADHWPSRNSNIEAWLEFADNCEYRVVFIRDTKYSHAPLEGAITDPIASVDLEYRIALYDQAILNMGVNGGPMGLTSFMDCDWLWFGQLNPDYIVGTPEAFEAIMGVKVGEQLPWASPTQRMAWTGDSLEEIEFHFNEMMRVKNG